jgi:hypothetical protein
MVKRVRYGCPVDAAILRDQLRYDAESGHIYWRERRQGRPKFGQAGTLDAKYERHIRIGDYILKATSVIWAMHTGQHVFGPIRRRNGQVNDNRIENLEDGWAANNPSCEEVVSITPLGMDFSDALRALKSGKRIARKRWNDKDTWLAINGSVGGEIVMADYYLRSETLVRYGYENGGMAQINQNIVLKTFDGSLVVGWSASQIDILADDWIVVPE